MCVYQYIMHTYSTMCIGPQLAESTSCQVQTDPFIHTARAFQHPLYKTESSFTVFLNNNTDSDNAQLLCSTKGFMGARESYSSTFFLNPRSCHQSRWCFGAEYSMYMGMWVHMHVSACTCNDPVNQLGISQSFKNKALHVLVQVKEPLYTIWGTHS